jgi:hypothetical protein
VVAEPERPLVLQRDEQPNCWGPLPLQARWVTEAQGLQGLQAEAAREPPQPLAGALLCPVLQVLLR